MLGAGEILGAAASHAHSFREGTCTSACAGRGGSGCWVDEVGDTGGSSTVGISISTAAAKAAAPGAPAATGTSVGIEYSRTTHCEHTAVCTRMLASDESSAPGLTTISCIGGSSTPGSGGTIILSDHSTIPGAESSSMLIEIVVTEGSSCSASCSPNACICWKTELIGRARNCTPMKVNTRSSINWCQNKKIHGFISNTEVVM
mmetsp:Transcript_43571/g.107799  ORF Transcript_43571/g.107799 Transcript_43571/m.107799 type:complete len:203 (-) Transcript_43571:194-802(-)